MQAGDGVKGQRRWKNTVLSRHGARLLVIFSVSDACSDFLSDVCVLLDLLEPRRFQEDPHFLFEPVANVLDLLLA